MIMWSGWWREMMTQLVYFFSFYYFIHRTICDSDCQFTVFLLLLLLWLFVYIIR